MASGTPVVVSDSPSLREVCGTAVEYVDPTSVDDMHRGLETVLSSETRREQMSSEGYVQAAKLTWKNSIEQFMRVVERTGDHQ
jgi:glycosyltransferase involved in cell wall biosynthesis